MTVMIILSILSENTDVVQLIGLVYKYTDVVSLKCWQI